MKTKFGSIVVNGTGRLGGHSIGTGSKGSYLSNHSTKKKTVSPAQTANRLRVNKINRHWNSLTIEQKNSFNNAVDLWLDSDMFGDVQQLTGRQLHFKFNMFNLLAGQAQINVAPVKLSMFKANYGELFVRWSNNRVAINTIGSIWIGKKAIIYASPIGSNSIELRESSLCFLGVSINAASRFLLDGKYIQRFGLGVPGANIIVGFRIVLSNGQVSPMYWGTAAVIA